MNILMARVDQYISGDHKSSQVTPQLQLISVTEVPDCICCCFSWTQILCNLYHGEGCACYTNEMVRLDLVKQNYRLKYHLHTHYHFFHQVCLGCILSVSHVPVYHLRRVAKCRIIKAEQNWQNVFAQNWCREPHYFYRPPERLQTSQMPNYITCCCWFCKKKEWFYYKLFMGAMNVKIFCDISQLWIGTRGVQLKR